MFRTLTMAVVSALAVLLLLSSGAQARGGGRGGGAWGAAPLCGGGNFAGANRAPRAWPWQRLWKPQLQQQQRQPRQRERRPHQRLFQPALWSDRRGHQHPQRLRSLRLSRLRGQGWPPEPPWARRPSGRT